MSSYQQGQSVLSPGGRYRAIARGNTQAIHLATPVVAYCLRPHSKEVPHG